MENDFTTMRREMEGAESATDATTPQINQDLPPGIVLVQADNFDEWLLDIRVLDDNPLYKGQIYRLRFKFGSSYPIGTSQRT